MNPEIAFTFFSIMINFVFEDREFKFKKSNLKEALKSLILFENKKPGDISIIICSDDYLLKVNQDYLNHDYFTDIITFDYSDNEKISGDLFISLDRVFENASSNKVELLNEFHRVVFHGVLHLCGYKDKTKTDIALMRSKENFYLEKFSF